MLELFKSLILPGISQKFKYTARSQAQNRLKTTSSDLVNLLYLNLGLSTGLPSSLLQPRPRRPSTAAHDSSNYTPIRYSCKYFFFSEVKKKFHLSRLNLRKLYGFQNQFRKKKKNHVYIVIFWRFLSKESGPRLKLRNCFVGKNKLKKYANLQIYSSSLTSLLPVCA